MWNVRDRSTRLQSLPSLPVLRQTSPYTSGCTSRKPRQQSHGPAANRSRYSPFVSVCPSATGSSLPAESASYSRICSPGTGRPTESVTRPQTHPAVSVGPDRASSPRTASRMQAGIAASLTHDRARANALPFAPRAQPVAGNESRDSPCHLACLPTCTASAAPHSSIAICSRDCRMDQQ